ncbi:hypothetical protein RDI58_025584 [Solanum bulbocastanum]|uniref:Uncharacterized protein n=1 Tax=Solanum bulbocastanum TaxID=147425 RepID=A0AAN8T7Z0_SOLBU
MDPRFRYVGLTVNPQLSAFKNLGKSIAVGGAGVGGGYCADNTLRLDSIGSSVPSIPAPKGIKRKWSSIGESNDQPIGSSLCLRLGHSSSSSDNKGSSGAACTSMSSARENDEESSMDLDLDFSLHLGSEKTSSSRKSAHPESKKLAKGLAVDLELSLSSDAAESDVTTVHFLSTSPQCTMKAP